MQSIALENGNQQIEQIHLLDALVSKEDGLIPNLVISATSERDLSHIISTTIMTVVAVRI